MLTSLRKLLLAFGRFVQAIENCQQHLGFARKVGVDGPIGNASLPRNLFDRCAVEALFGEDGGSRIENLVAPGADEQLLNGIVDIGHLQGFLSQYE